MSFDADAKEVAGHCPHCRGDRTSTVYGYGKNRWDDDENGMFGKEVYRVLRCDGCSTFYFQKQSIFSEDIDQWYDNQGRTCGELVVRTQTWPPPRHHEQPDWSDDLVRSDRLLHKLLASVYTANDAGLLVLAAIGTRTVFDRAAELMNVDQSKTFAQKLNALEAAGLIASGEKNFLEVLVDAGSAAAHRGWEPTTSEMSKLLMILESFLLKCFILPAEVDEISRRVPKRAPLKKPKS